MPTRKKALLQTEPLERALFVARPNRFLVRFRKGRTQGVAHLGNPGRLGEILLPGVELLVARRPHTKVGREVVGATWSSRWPGDPPRTVYLNTGKLNRLAESLLERRLLPELSTYAIAKREFSWSGSRFDFLLARGQEQYVLEVKSVTLVEQRLAMFPDAQTDRGRRHIEELVRYRRKTGQRAGVLFLVQGAAERFLPDFHNDLEFARTFHAAQGKIDFFAYCLDPALVDGDALAFRGRPYRLSMPLDILPEAVADSGLYLLVLELPAAARLEVGALGHLSLQRGHYVYVGSARRGLTRRIERHLRRRKRFHYHIDYLRDRAGAVRGYPLRGTRIEECDLADKVRSISDGRVDGFGSSDCECPGHLFHFNCHPVRTPAFQELLTRLRHSPG